MLKYTEWFKYNIKPVRKGFYLCECDNKHFWDGKNWHQSDINSKVVIFKAFDFFKWRGLTEESK